MKLFIIFIIIILIMSLPIPIKLKIEYTNYNLVVKLYKFIIFSSNKGIENKYLRKLIKKNTKQKDNINKEKKHIRLSYKKLYKNISNNKFKPSIKINASIIYGVEDAALSAVLYGILCNLPNLVYFLFCIVFKIKDLSFNIKPKFNTTVLSFEITSIFYSSIANIIYILYLLIKSKKK